MAMETRFAPARLQSKAPSGQWARPCNCGFSVETSGITASVPHVYITTSILLGLPNLDRVKLNPDDRSSALQGE
jgi:hypothetical protein